MRRFSSALCILTMNACAHESNRHEAHEPSNRRQSAVHARGAETLPPAEAEALAPEDRGLGAQFRAAPALTTLEGEASYYSDRLAGHKTASGEPYRPRALTAAHRSLPLGTVLRVTRSDGKRSVYVRINDRGPYGRNRRILDLSRAAFEQLGRLRAGVLEIRAEVVAYGPKRGH